MVHGSQYLYCRKKYNSSSQYRNHIETAHSGFVQSQTTFEQSMYDKEDCEQKQYSAANLDLFSNLLDQDLGTIKPYTGKDKRNIDQNEEHSDVKSLNHLDTGTSRSEVGLLISTKYTTVGQSLQDVIQHEWSKDKMQLLFKNKIWFWKTRSYTNYQTKSVTILLVTPSVTLAIFFIL